MPDGYSRRQTFEHTVACVFDWEEAALSLRAFVPLARLESLHQSDFRAVSQRNLLVTTTNPENRLACVFNDLENSSQRLWRVLVPRMTLSTQDDVRRPQAANSLERYGVKRFGEDLQPGDQAAQHRAKLARAGALAIDCVVDEVNEQGYFKL